MMIINKNKKNVYQKWKANLKIITKTVGRRKIISNNIL